MQPEDLEQLLRESDPVEAGRLVAAMEPDEAVDALRDLPLAVRGEVLRHIPAVTALALRELLGYEENEAGGIMTTALVTAKSGDKVKKVVDRLSEARAHGADLDAVAVVDDDGRLLDDVSVLDILLALRDVDRHADVRAPRRRGRRDGEPAHVGQRCRRATGRSAAPFDGGRQRRRVPHRAHPGRRRARRAGPDQGSLPLSTPSVMKVQVSRRWLIYLAAAGPGLIAAAAGNDAGGIVTYSSAGAQFIYRTLFLMVLITIAYVIVQEMVARLATLHRQGPGRPHQGGVRPPPHRLRHHRLRHRQRRPDGHRVRRHRHLVRVVQRLALHLGAHCRRGHLVARALRLLPLRRAHLPPPHPRLHRLPDCRRLAHPNWHEVAVNTVWPHFEASKSFLLLSVALIGTTITPYIQLYEAGAVVDKGVKPENYHFQRVDAITGAVLAALVAMSIIIATGATIGGTGPLTSATTAAEGLKPVAGAFATTLFGIGLLGASALAAAVVPLSTSYAVAEAIGVERSVSSSFRQAPVFLGIFTFQILIGAAVVLVPGNLITLILNTQVLEGVITPMTLILILVLANRRSLLGSAANGPVARWVGGLAIVSVAVGGGRLRGADRARLVRPGLSRSAGAGFVRGAVCAGPGGSGRLEGHGASCRDIRCLKRLARSGLRQRSPGSALATLSCPPRFPLHRPDLGVCASPS